MWRGKIYKRTDGQTQPNTIPLRPENPRNKNRSLSFHNKIQRSAHRVHNSRTYSLVYILLETREMQRYIVVSLCHNSHGVHTVTYTPSLEEMDRYDSYQVDSYCRLKSRPFFPYKLWIQFGDSETYWGPNKMADILQATFPQIKLVEGKVWCFPRSSFIGIILPVYMPHVWGGNIQGRNKYFKHILSNNFIALTYYSNTKYSEYMDAWLVVCAYTVYH